MKSPIIPAALSLVFGLVAIALTIAPAPIHALWPFAFVVSCAYATVSISRIHPV